EEHRAGQQHVQRRGLVAALGGQRVPVPAARGLGRRGGGGPGGLVGVGGAVGQHLGSPSRLPRQKGRWRNRNRITGRRATMTAPAAGRAVSEVYWPWKFARPSGAVRSLPLGAMTRAMRNSFQVHMNTSTSMVTIAGREAGTRIRTRACSGPAPSIAAAST